MAGMYKIDLSFFLLSLILLICVWLFVYLGQAGDLLARDDDRARVQHADGGDTSCLHLAQHPGHVVQHAVQCPVRRRRVAVADLYR